MPQKRHLLDFVGWVALLALVVPMAARPLSHDDLFWHLQSGAWMAEHHMVPHVDPFSFTRQGAPWVTHEWGFSLLVYGIWIAGGYLALIVTRVLLILLIGWILVRTMELEGPEEARGYLPVALLLAGLWTVSAEIILRAALLSELFLALTLLLLARYRKTGRPRELACIAGLFWIWANVHSGVVFGLFVLGLFTLEALIRRQGRPYLLTLAAAGLLSLANPNGIEALLYPFRLSRILFASGIPWDLGHFEASSPAANSGLLILAVLLLAGLLPLRKVPVRVAEVVAIATFVVLLYRSPRFVFHAVILALPVIYRLWAKRKRSNLAAGVVVLLALASTLVGWATYRPRPLALGVPEPAARFVQKMGIRGRMFNHQNYGGYLLWSLKEPVFWDGRNDVFAPLVKEYVSTPFPELMDRYQVEWALITEHEWDPEFQSARWGLVYWDDFCAIYLRRIPRFEHHLEWSEKRVVPPFGGWPGMEAVSKDPMLAARAQAELSMILDHNPESQRARYFRALLSLRQGKVDEARWDLEKALAVRPNEQVSRLLESLPK
ncbi:MAG TPA: hypothetical protein VH394_25840 [Thermoanaerobaculia bacterium]|jgi:hypothetical protein|nr:hypothetical protein [Thermoanaerobaculia bacterium]